MSLLGFPPQDVIILSYCFISTYFFVLTNLFSFQASPESDGEKDRKGRDKDKDKENDKSRGKNRSESKQKSPKRKAPKEEVRLHFSDFHMI